MSKICVYSLDYDGCFDSASANFKKDLQKKSTYYDQTIVLVGSNRQCFHTNQAGIEQNKNGCAFRTLASFQKKFLSENRRNKLDKFLMADLYNNQKSGTAFNHATRIDAKGIFQGYWTFDESKITLLYAQMHKIATEHPEDEIDFFFYDDRKDILRALRSFFSKYQFLIPSKITLNLTQYRRPTENHPQGVQFDHYKHFFKQKGSGKPDQDYTSTVITMADATQNEDYIIKLGSNKALADSIIRTESEQLLIPLSQRRLIALHYKLESKYQNLCYREHNQEADIVLDLFNQLRTNIHSTSFADQQKIQDTKTLILTAYSQVNTHRDFFTAFALGVLYFCTIGIGYVIKERYGFFQTDTAKMLNQLLSAYDESSELKI